MSVIHCVYSEEPGFPATDQRSDAVRYRVGAYWVDATEGEPTEAEVLAAISPGLPDLLPYQFWAMVEISGKRKALEDFAATLPGNQKIIAQAKLQHTLSFRRDNPLVEAARQGIGLSNEELDALWLQAAAL